MKSSSSYKLKYNWCVTGTLETSISKSNLWNIISSPSNLELFHPFCEKNPTISWPGLNSTDQIYYYNGLILQREFIEWNEGQGYDLLIGEEGGPKSFVSWKINEIEDRSRLSVSVYPHIYNRGNKLINFTPFTLIVKPSLTSYINSVMMGLEYYIKMGIKVKKNQFGGHSYFSN